MTNEEAIKELGNGEFWDRFKIHVEREPEQIGFVSNLDTGRG